MTFFQKNRNILAVTFFLSLFILVLGFNFLSTEVEDFDVLSEVREETLRQLSFSSQ